jgi:hypothetical protein
MDPGEAERVFGDVLETWLRERLSGAEDSLIAELVMEDPAQTIALVRTVAMSLRQHRQIGAAPSTSPQDLVRAFLRNAEELRSFMERAEAQEEETAAIAACFEEMSDALASALSSDDPASVVKLLLARPHVDLCTKSGSFSVYKKKGK